MGKIVLICNKAQANVVQLETRAMEIDMNAPEASVPAYRIIQVIAILLGFAGFLCLGIFAGQLSSGTEGSSRWVLLVGGSILLLIGLKGPVRVIRKGTLIPLEIRKTILVQAIVLPLMGLSLVFCGLLNSGTGTMLASLLAGLLLLCSSLLGFLPLSRKLPSNFYISEMLAIIKSAGLAGNRENSPADREFMRWTSGIRSGVAVGEPAPDGDVIDLKGINTRLSSYFPQQPSTVLVLNFGSYTCPHYRKRIDELKALQAKWADRGVQFLTVYTAEAHPKDGWHLDNQYVHDEEYTGVDDFCFYYAKTPADRRAMAQWLIDKKQLRMQVVLDAMEDSLLKAFNSWPIRLYALRDGRVVYCGEQGPFGYSPSDLDQALTRLRPGSSGPD